MKSIFYSVLILMFATLAGCSDSDDDEGEIEIEQIGLFLDVNSYQTTTSTTFEYDNIEEISVTSYPTGWAIDVSLDTETITVTAPSDLEDNEDYGMVYIIGKTEWGNSVVATMYVGKVPFIDLDDVDGVDMQANSMIVSQPNTYYTFNARRRGESTAEVPYRADDGFIEWCTSSNVIKFAQAIDGGDRIGFYIPYDTNDIDDDDDTEDLPCGNAVISAINSNDEPLWSWHIWITDDEITTAGSSNFMNRNLGALLNDNSDTDNILDSYGLYYQWGRKDPFVGAATFDAAYGAGATVYDGTGSTATFSFIDSTSTTGTLYYAYTHPKTFLLGVANSYYDWFYGSTRSDYLWDTVDGKKSIYDPSPKGWRVPSTADFDAITNTAVASSSPHGYGVTLDGELWMALGLRTYFDGVIRNEAGDYSHDPWSGHYWSREANGTTANALHFWYRKDSDIVTVDTAESSYRANGMQIRCVLDN